MAMKFRQLKLTSKYSLGVYRSLIHGRGLFCLRDIEAGEMVIEYAGEVCNKFLLTQNSTKENYLFYVILMIRTLNARDSLLSMRISPSAFQKLSAHFSDFKDLYYFLLLMTTSIIKAFYRLE